MAGVGLTQIKKIHKIKNQFKYQGNKAIRRLPSADFASGSASSP
jgi:hypothetical protein